MSWENGEMVVVTGMCGGGHRAQKWKRVLSLTPGSSLNGNMTERIPVSFVTMNCPNENISSETKITFYLRKRPSICCEKFCWLFVKETIFTMVFFHVRYIVTRELSYPLDRSGWIYHVINIFTAADIRISQVTLNSRETRNYSRCFVMDWFRVIWCWKIHAGDVLSSLSLFRVCRTELHEGRVGQGATRSAEKQIRCNSPFFSLLRVTLILCE